ncbi:MAG: hypothetical protein PHF68_03045, partial [Candidatus ainarchaeum sp.]|nr:hypothetical protein [Candidatus Paceibacterota bacterium]MDD4468103.1 hypothetical protein [Candidatus ainarchaeum sp.]
EKGKIKIDIKAKEDDIDLDKIEGEFNNELINASLRVRVFEENRNVREMIVNIALNGIDKNQEKLSYQKDSEGICKKWEDSISNTHIALEKPKNVSFSAHFPNNDK